MQGQQQVKYGRDVAERTTKRMAVFNGSGMSTSSLLLTVDQCAAWLGVEPSTLHRWRKQDRGPRFVPLSPRDFRYKVSDVRAWLDGQTIEPNPKRRFR